MVYGCAPWLEARKTLIRALRVTQQDDPLGMYLFSVDIQPPIYKLQEGYETYSKVCCANDGTLIGPLDEIVEAKTTIKDSGAALGYHLEVSNSKLWCPSVDQAKRWTPRQSPQDDRISSRSFPSNSSRGNPRRTSALIVQFPA